MKSDGCAFNFVYVRFSQTRSRRRMAPRAARTVSPTAAASHAVRRNRSSFCNFLWEPRAHQDRLVTNQDRLGTNGRKISTFNLLFSQESISSTTATVPCCRRCKKNRASFLRAAKIPHKKTPRICQDRLQTQTRRESKRERYHLCLFALVVPK